MLLQEISHTRPFGGLGFSPEEQELQERARRLAEERIAPIAAEVDESDRVSPELMRILSEASLLRYCVPEEYGGYGIKVVHLCIIREELTRVSALADTNFIMQGLGSYPITLGGTPEQKAWYLPPIAKGEAIPAFALTEPSGGSDVTGMKTSAVPWTLSAPPWRLRLWAWVTPDTRPHWTTPGSAPCLGKLLGTFKPPNSN